MIYEIYSGQVSSGIELYYDSMYVYSGGVANSTTVDYSGYMYVSSGGTANATTVDDGHLYVYAGGVANSITVRGYDDYYYDDDEDDYSQLHVYSGGTALNVDWAPWKGGRVVVDNGATVTYVPYRGVYFYDYYEDVWVSSAAVTGQTLSDYDRDRIYVMQGGTATSFSTDDYENLYVYSGGTANSVTVNDENRIYVYSGGTALNVDWAPWEGGELYAYNGATVTYADSHRGVYIIDDYEPISSAATMTSVTLDDEDHDYDMYVMQGGTANYVSVTAEGRHLKIYSGGVANYVTVSGHYYEGGLDIYAGGVANYISGKNFENLRIHAGGTASYITLAGRGYYDGFEEDSYFNTLTVSDGATVNHVTVSAFGRLHVTEGGTVNDTVLGGSAYRFDCYDEFDDDEWCVSKISDRRTAPIAWVDGGTANDTTVYRGGRLVVTNFGTAKGLLATGDDAVVVVSGGEVRSATIKNDALLEIQSGGTVNVASAKNNGQIFVYGDAAANSVTVRDWGVAYVFAGASADEITVGSCGELHVARGGKATGVVENGGAVEIAEGAEVTFAENTFSDLELTSGMATVHSGTVAKGTRILNGSMLVYSGGIADSATVTEGELEVRGGGKLTGKVDIVAGGEVSLAVESVVDFDISTVAPGGAALINDWSLVDDAGAYYTITTAEKQAAGTYALAGGAAGFDKSITVVTVAGAELGAITVGGELATEDLIYSLGLSAGTLSLTVKPTDTEPPVEPVAKADITIATNKDVTVTATFSDDSAVKEYSLDNKTWRTYTTGVVMKDNGNVYFRAADEAGNISDVTTYTVANIDRIPPAKPVAAADITKKTGKDVTVTATFSSDSVKKEYSLDNKVWKTYTTGVVFAANGTAYFRATDAAGNVSPVTTYKVTNIDTTLAPTGKAISGATGKDTPAVTYKAELDAAGLYTVTGKFGTMKGTVTIYDGAKKVASGSIKAGVLTFKKDALLDSKKSYTVEIKNTDKKSDGAAFTWTLTAKELFTKGDNSNDTLKGAKTLAAGTPANDWVGYGDAVDYYKLGVDARGGFYDFSISGVRNNVKLTIYAADGRKVKGVTVSAKKPAVALANLCLAKGSYAVIEAPKAAKAQNSDYTLKLTQKAVFTGAKNNDWAQAEVLAKGATFTGVLTKAAGGDVVDYCDVSKIDSLTLSMTAGKTKVSFFDKDRKAVKVASVKMANGSEKKNASSLTLAAGNAATGSFTLAAIDDAVKYLKIEASGKTLNGYTITKIG